MALEQLCTFVLFSTDVLCCFPIAGLEVSRHTQCDYLRIESLVVSRHSPNNRQIWQVLIFTRPYTHRVGIREFSASLRHAVVACLRARSRQLPQLSTRRRHHHKV